MDIQKRVIEEWVVTLSDEELDILSRMHGRWSELKGELEGEADLDIGMALVKSIVTYQDSDLRELVRVRPGPIVVHEAGEDVVLQPARPETMNPEEAARIRMDRQRKLSPGSFEFEEQQ